MVPHKQALTLFFCIVCIGSHAIGQVIDAESSKTNDRNFVTGLVEVYKSTTPLSLDSVILNHKNQFKRIAHSEVVFEGYNSYYYWFRLIVRNKSESAKKLVLLLGPLGMRASELFRSDSGSFTSLGKTGTSYPFEDRPYQYSHFAYPVTFPPNSLDTLYLSMDFGHEYRSYAFVLMDNKVLKKYENSLYLVYGIIIGLLLLFLVLNLYLFFSLRESIHIWYSLYIFFVVLVVMVNDQLGDQFLNFDSELAYKLTNISTVGGLAISVLIHVVQLFLTNIKNDSLLYRITSFIKYMIAISALCHLLAFVLTPGVMIEEIMFSWVNISTIVGILTILANCLYAYFRGFRAALPILLGLSVFFIGSLQKLLTLNTPSYLFPPTLFHIGIILETTTISFVLFYRYRHERKENLDFIRDREKRKLMYEKEILEQNLDLQEKTFKKISREIHDNIGQLLSFIKLNLNNISLLKDNLQDNVSESEILLGRAIQDLGHLSMNAHHDFIIQTGLVESIRRETEMIKKMDLYTTQLSIIGQPVGMGASIESILFRMVQEVLTNIIKHAEATEVSIDLVFQPPLFSIKITDNGKGFSMDDIKGNIKTYGLGIRNIESRAKDIGAELSISSILAEGTSITLSMVIPADGMLNYAQAPS